LTPIRNQYLSVKHSYPDAIVLFRLGDFYETFDRDAELVAHDLEITLTSRNMGKNLRVPMAGVPAHSLDNYLGRLVTKGHKVAICEQLSDPSESKGLVDRDVVRVVTPGTVLEPNLLEQDCNNYLMSIIEESGVAGLSYVDITTGEFCTSEVTLTELSFELDRILPAEILVPQDQSDELKAIIIEKGIHITTIDSCIYGPNEETQILLDYYDVLSIEAFGCSGRPLAIRACASVIEYVKAMYKTNAPELGQPVTYATNEYMTVDKQTRKNLEIFESGATGDKSLSLLAELDKTQTAMGSRLLRSWLGQPLLDVKALTFRLDAVEFFFNNLVTRSSIRVLLKDIADLERIVSRTISGKVLPRELIALLGSIQASEKLTEVLNEEQPVYLSRLSGDIIKIDDLTGLISSSINDNPSGNVGDGSIIKEGFSSELDELKMAISNAREFIAQLEQTERNQTGIKNLKVGYNQVFGYYIEITKSNTAQVPDTYIRRQTLTGAERYIIPELKEYESLVLNAKEKISALENDLYKRICHQVSAQSEKIRGLSQGIGNVDVFCSFAEVAQLNSYVRPIIDNGSMINISGGRHPVVENVLAAGSYVSNDVELDNDDTRVIVLTGPNMAGKSTFIRQVAIITLMAQIGSFVPATSAHIGLVDRIFTRVGLQDDLTTGKSTFMVEMVETALILNLATSRSLLILDEIGRGTSTYDGLSIARSVIEYVHSNPRLKCKTMFATHYHELTTLQETLPGVRNFNVAVVEQGSKIVFLHKIISGGADRSYGVHVAQLAGMPAAVVKRAWEILSELETVKEPSKGHVGLSRQEVQMSLFSGVSDILADELRNIDIENLTPIEAINRLYDLKRKADDMDNEL